MGAPARLQEPNFTQTRSRAHKSSSFPLEAIFQAALSRKPTPLRASSISIIPALPGSALLLRHLQTLPRSRSAAIRRGAREQRAPAPLPASVTVTSPRSRNSWGQGAAPQGWGGLCTSVCCRLQLCQVLAEPLTCSRIQHQLRELELVHLCSLSSGREHPGSRWEEGKCQQQAALLAGWDKKLPQILVCTRRVMRSGRMRSLAFPGSRDLTCECPRKS